MNTKPMSTMSRESIDFLEELTGKQLTMGNLLWSIRECEELKQSAFAEKLGISRQYLCDLEHGRRMVSPKMASDFAVKLGYSPTQFIRIALQDELNKYGLHFDIQLTKQKDAA